MKYTIGTRYIIEETSIHRSGTHISFYEYKILSVDCFTGKKSKAFKFNTEQEALEVMKSLEAKYNPDCFSFSVVPVRCRIYEED